MKKILWLLVLVCTSIVAQKKYTISGTVKDASTGETLIGVTVINTEGNEGTYTNEYGFYSLTVNDVFCTLEFNYLGYQSQSQRINLNNNSSFNISLQESIESLDAVILNSTSETVALKKAEMSVNKLKIKTIKEIPAVLGEVDILKSITTLPGVTNPGEGQSGFNVRGGAADQNLVLLDGSTIYNTSHLFGFFSVMNPDAIKDLKLFKGGTPAKYGGRISSVLDVYQKEGNKYEFHGNGGIGLITSRLTLEGPVKKEKASFFLSGRRSYADVFLPIVQPDNENTAFFYDLHTKFNWEINEKNKLYLSGYFGKDVFNLSNSFKNQYGNGTENLRWNHIFNNKLFSNMSFVYNNYYYGLELDFVGFLWDSGLENFNFNYDFSNHINDNVTVNFGTTNNGYIFNPGKIQPNSDESTITTEQLAKRFAFESALYVDIEHKVNEKIDLRYGLRLSGFARLGEDDVNLYQDTPVVYDENTQVYEAANAINQENLPITDIQKTYFNLEPRFSIAYTLNDNNSIKASYQRMAQYIHLISNTQSPSPLDIWAPSGQHIKPQLSDQIALGYQANIANKYSLIAEAFGKTVANRLDYIDGADLIAQPAIETQVLAGEARAYGLEMMFKKDSGKFNGWISYTLSRSEQKTEGRTDSEIGINNGEWYATGFDKTHDITLVANYKASPKWKFSTLFTFQTGQPVTYPTGAYVFRELLAVNYDQRNSSRLPAYHRLDFSATYKKQKISNSKFNGEWVFSVYNIYNRQNWASVTFGQNRDTGRNVSERLSIFGIIPSVSYNFKF